MVDIMSFTFAISIQSIFQHICDSALAIPFSGALESQCRQSYTEVACCPGFSGSNFLQVLECHVDYVVSQCERTYTRAMAHRTAAVDVPSEATARSLPLPLPCASVTSITELMLSFGPTVIEAAKVRVRCPDGLSARRFVSAS
jgi:hypothetical protein